MKTPLELHDDELDADPTLVRLTFEDFVSAFAFFKEAQVDHFICFWSSRKVAPSCWRVWFRPTSGDFR
jgi:hypothetical protein